MQYSVDVNGTRHTVTLDGAVATMGAWSTPAALDPLGTNATCATPVRIVRLGDRVVRVVMRHREGRGAYVLEVDGVSYTVEALDTRTRAIRDMTAKAAGASGPAPIKAPMPGLIVRVTVAVGDVVQAGQGVIVMEAMKMENEFRATTPGVVKAISVQPGTAVEKGAVLVELDPLPEA